jgi:hypothetical protein
VAGGRRDDDCVEGRLLWPPIVAIAVPNRCIGVAEPRQACSRCVGKRAEDLDRVDLGAGGGENGGLVPGACPHLEDAHPLAGPNDLGHVSHDIRLRDGLPEPDGQRMILVGLITQLCRDELVAWHVPHRA